MGAEMPKIMVDDTNAPLESPPPDSSRASLLADMASIAVHTIDRQGGCYWVTHRLKPLVCDYDEEEDSLPYDRDDPDGVERYVLALSLQDDEEGNGDDDGGDKNNNDCYDSDDSEEMERYAVALSLQGNKNDIDTEPKKGRFSDEVARSPPRLQ